MPVTPVPFELKAPVNRFKKSAPAEPIGKFKEELAFVGTVQNLTYRDEESGFFIANIRHESGIVRAMTGFTLSVCPGEVLSAEGEWVSSEYGRQFKAKSVSTRLPDDLSSIETYLAHAIKGVGKTAAKNLVAKFGTRVFDVIAAGPDGLKGVGLVGPKRAKSICEAFIAQRHNQSALVFLFSMGVTPGRAHKAIKHFGAQAIIQTLTENPYRLQEIPGIGFPLADLAALKAGIPRDSDFRVRSGISHILRTAESEGACGVLHTRLMETAKVLLDVSELLISACLATLIEQKEVYAADCEGQRALYLRRTYQAEREVGRMLSDLAKRRLKPISDPEAAIRRAEDALGVVLDDVQRTAALTMLNAGVGVITGGPGTGKTTTTRVLIKAFVECGMVVKGIVEPGLAVKLMAPTGKAAKRASEATGHPASTIHRGLGFTPGGFTFNSSNPLPADVLIVDETSIMGVFLTRSVLSSLAPTCRLIFLGDVDQLPSVEPGRVLADIIEAKHSRIPVVRLKRIFRQGAESHIKDAAHLVNSGLMPKMAYEQGSDFVFRSFQAKDDSDEAKEAYKLAMEQDVLNIAKSLARRGFDPRSDVQVLAPGKRGPLGTESLNRKLQGVLNPNPVAAAKVGEVTWQTGDRVMQIRNAYKRGTGVFNGDIGFIRRIDAENKLIAVAFDEQTVEYEYSDLDELQLAYASTVHKSQGSEFPVVILVVDWSHFTLLVRNLVYTGMTRAKKLLVMVANPGAVKKAVQTEDTAHRYTLLKSWLRAGDNNA